MYTYYCVVNKSLSLWDKMGYSTCRLLDVVCYRHRSVAEYLRGLIVFPAHWKRFWSDYKSQPWNYIFLSSFFASLPCSICCFCETKSELSDASSSWALNFKMTSGYWPFVVGFLFTSFFSMSLTLFSDRKTILSADDDDDANRIFMYVVNLYLNDFCCWVH